MAYSTILYDLADGVATLTFNRPEVRNAFNAAMAEEVQSALKNAERDENVRCVVITGAGQGFCAGQDLARAIVGARCPSASICRGPITRS
jgi:2-(1,2-epoxy-1,2-dihydrophenyl)acetyl-CoA isomerase